MQFKDSIEQLVPATLSSETLHSVTIIASVDTLSVVTVPMMRSVREGLPVVTVGTVGAPPA